MSHLTVLSAVDRAATPAPVPRLFWRPSEVAAMTGASLSSVLRALDQRELEGYRRGRGWFIPTAAVDRWITGASAVMTRQA